MALDFDISTRELNRLTKTETASKQHYSVKYRSYYKSTLQCCRPLKCTAAATRPDDLIDPIIQHLSVQVRLLLGAYNVLRTYRVRSVQYSYDHPFFPLLFW